jgi:hypothetical protein
MLSTVLHKHIDAMDEIEEKAKNEIDKIIGSIDIKEIMADPHIAMQQIAEQVNKVMTEKYMALAIEEGTKLVKTINKLEKNDETILIDPSKDPTKNKEIVND